ncbi:MAG TPA: hypothetical protein VLM40_04425, partial [Gemmata sp.]|nr:hypothetical protein [Gemmata sp.]
MRNPSRLFSALIVSIALPWAGGCGSKDEPENNPHPIPEPRGEAPSSSNSAAPPAEASYQLDPAKHVLPSAQVSGVLGGEKVTAEVRLEGQRLILRKPEAAGGAMWQIWIDLPPEAHRGGTTRLVIGPDRMPPLKVMVEYPMEIATKEWEFFSFRGWEPKKLHAWEGGCSMTLEMGKREKGKIAGKIYLALAEIESRDPAARQSFLAGSFVADCPRLPTEPPGVDDVPLINGNIAVKQAPAGAVLRVGFAATPTPSTFALGGTDIQLGEPIDPPRSSQASTDP